MKNTIPAVDAYIAQAAPFAKPILERLRATLHAASPELREEMKWSAPHFVRNGIVAGMAAFKEHVSFGFWRSAEMSDPEKLFERGPKASMCVVRLRTVKDVPSKKVLAKYVEQALALDDAGPKKKAATSAKKPAPKAPDDLMAALRKVRKALATYAAFSPSKQREYVEWVSAAKREETRAKRIAQAVEWMAEGKSRNWKYERC